MGDVVAFQDCVYMKLMRPFVPVQYFFGSMIFLLLKKIDLQCNSLLLRFSAFQNRGNLFDHIPKWVNLYLDWFTANQSLLPGTLPDQRLAWLNLQHLLTPAISQFQSCNTCEQQCGQMQIQKVFDSEDVASQLCPQCGRQHHSSSNRGILNILY